VPDLTPARLPKNNSEEETVPPTPPDSAELEAMALALAEARRAAAEGEIPVGALVLGPAGEILATGRNTREASADPTGHAEIVAIRHAAQQCGEVIIIGTLRS